MVSSEEDLNFVSFVFGEELILSDVQGLLLTMHSGIISGGLKRSYGIREIKPKFATYKISTPPSISSYLPPSYLLFLQPQI